MVVERYNLFAFRGQKARHGFAQDNISVIFTYVVADKYLKKHGTLGFLLKQTLFTNEAGAAFRQFCIKKGRSSTALGVQAVTDLREIAPFRP